MRVLVIGDVMIDRYTYVKSTRQAAEASMPVWDEISQESRPGGAANLARNVKAIGGESVDVHLCGIMDRGDVGQTLKKYDVNGDLIVCGSTMVKHRFVDRDTGKYVFRHDNFQQFYADDIEWFETVISGHIFHNFDVAIISDYNKGTVTEEIVQAVRGSVPLVVVDSKREDLRIFDGVNVLKLNEHEYSAQASSRHYANFTKFFEHCVITMGEKGAVLQMCEHIKSNERRYIVHSENFPTDPKKAVDVTGCGDTFTAALAYDLIKSGGDIRRAIRFANYCSGKVVEKFGTETI